MLFVLQVLQPTGTAPLLGRPEWKVASPAQPGGRRCSAPGPAVLWPAQQSTSGLGVLQQCGYHNSTSLVQRITFFCGIIKYNWAWSKGCLWKSSSFWLCNVLLKLNDNERSNNHVRKRYNPNLRKIQDLKLIHQSLHKKSVLPLLHSKLFLFLLICVPLQTSLGQARVDLNEPAGSEFLPALGK